MDIKRLFRLGVTALSAVALAACGAEESSTSNGSGEKPADAPDTWIADRTITGLVFQSAGDASVDSMSPEIADYIKERTGITMELQMSSADDSTQALAAGMAAGDLPDFIAFYLNHSGRPEFPILLQAANEGVFHDIAPFLKEGETYGRYYEEGYLPRDTEQNIMMREDHDGATYLVHMNIPASGDVETEPTVGGMYIRKDIAEDLGYATHDVTSSEGLENLMDQIAEGGYTDANGAPITPLGPSVWGGSDREEPYLDLVWQGVRQEKIMPDENGNFKHESQTNAAEERVTTIRRWMEEGLMHPEYYTMEENRASEGVINGSWAIVSDMHSGRPELINNAGELQYIPVGAMNRYDGENELVSSYKSGYAGWAVPATTENPEEVVAFADWLAGPEGKLLYMYGLEDVHYDLDENNQPIVKEELLKLREEDPDAAYAEGFRGTRAYWGEHLAYTNMDNMDQYGEYSWGSRFAEDNAQAKAIREVADMFNYDERRENREVIDGLTPLAYIMEFEGEAAGALSSELGTWSEEIVKAIYAGSEEEAMTIIENAKNKIADKDIEGFMKFLDEKQTSGEVIFY